MLVGYCLNDRERNDGGILATLVSEAKGVKGAETGRSILHNSALFRVLWYRVLGMHKNRPKHFGTVSDDIVGESFAWLNKLSGKHGFRTMVAVFPELTDLTDYKFGAEHAFIEKLAANTELQVVDLLEPFRSCTGKLSRDRYHPNEKGHRCAANALADAIEPLVTP